MDFAHSGMVNFDNSKINGNFQCSGGKFFNDKYPAFSAKGAAIIRDLSLDNGFAPNGDIDLRRVKVGGRLTIDPAIQPSDASSQYKLDMRFAQIGTLSHNWMVWPKKDHLLLNGLVYNALGVQFRKTKHIDAVGWLRMQPQKSFSAQPYEQLAKVLRSSGDESATKRVFIARQEDLRRRGKLSGLQKLWNFFLGVTIKHGYEPQRAFYGMLGFVLVGFVIFWAADKHHIMSRDVEHEELANEDYPKFNAFLYSLDAFLPIVDLRQKGYWLPNAKKGHVLFPLHQVKEKVKDSSKDPVKHAEVRWGGVIRVYLVIHIVFGWVLTTLWVAGFTGLVRS
jgi:hypothetical protein